MKKLDYRKMIKAVDKLVETDFFFDIDCKLLPNASKYTQEEAKEMAKILGKIYMISHCTTCRTCQVKYLIP